MANKPPLWPTQAKGIAETMTAIAAGERRIVVTGPTGSGKSRMACDLIDGWLGEALRVAVYTNRKLLTEQISRVLSEHGIDHGVRAAEYESDLGYDVQVSSFQTENARTLRKKQWRLHEADRVLIDEAHVNKGEVARRIVDEHVEAGAAVVGLTATPLNLDGMYTCLVQAGVMSELRACGALLPAYHYAPDEPDLRHIGRRSLKGDEPDGPALTPGKDLTEKQNVKAMMVPGIFGRVYDNWKSLNPDARPAILFGPGVKESVWFAEQFQSKGVVAAHIDGADVWVNGKFYPSSREARKDVLQASRDGKVKVLCNRFVLREGVDAPWLYHGILACVFGSLGSYVQSGGRLLRAYQGLDHVVVQDHGGNWHRHGSLNADRTWKLDDTNEGLAQQRLDRLRDGNSNKDGGEKEPFLCPQCRMVLTRLRCPCGFVLQPGHKSRPVVMQDGTLIHMGGDVYRPREVSEAPDGPKLWKKMYFRARSAKWSATFRQAQACFFQETKTWPNPAWPFMPLHKEDMGRKVLHVPMDRLVPEGK